MIGSLFLLLLIALAVLVGCYVGQQHLFESDTLKPNLSSDYFKGLNYLLNEQPDKAIDVFTRLLQVDPETIEMHLALGSVFRRRGEIGRAIKIHQNIMARPQLPITYRTAAMIALGKDYLFAGLIDRAERLFLEVTSTGEQLIISLPYLLKIYQQQKNWLAAIKTAQQLAKVTRKTQALLIGHYYCELAQIEWQKAQWGAVENYLVLALKSDPHCVRASLMQGKLALQQKNYSLAISYLEKILMQDAVQTLPDLIIAYQGLQQETKLVDYLKSQLAQFNSIEVILYLTDFQGKQHNPAMAREFLRQYLQQHPSLQGLQYLMRLQGELNSLPDLAFLQEIMQRLLKQQSLYQCRQCGFKSSLLLWLCPGCETWGSLKPLAL